MRVDPLPRRAGPRDETRSPRKVGPYELHDAFAAGGMASVHFGRLVRAEGFAKTVVLKRLHEQYAKDETFLALFLDEARLAVRVQHPNVVSTLDVVTLDDEVFVVMEYVEGESLARLLGKAEHARRLEPALAFAIVAQLLRGLHAAHEARGPGGEPLGIVHRDVSPQNVIVGIDGLARLIDFGIAKAAGRARNTEDGVVKGKAGYMAPEQAFGDANARSDVFSAAVVLWEALTGRYLFHGSTPGATIAAVIHGDILAPSMVCPSLPQALDAVVLKGLARDPAQRYASAEEMAIALERAVPLASPTAIAEWVKATAREALERRSRMLATIDSGAPRSGERVVRARAETADETREHPLDVGASVESAAEPAPEDPPIARGDAIVTMPARSAPARARSRYGWLAVAALIGGIAAAVWHATGATPSAATAPVVAAPAATIALGPASGAAAIAPTTATTQATETPPTSTAVPASTPRAAPVVPRAAGAARVRSTSHANVRDDKPTPAVDCAQPFVFDSSGMKHYRPECL